MQKMIVIVVALLCLVVATQADTVVIDGGSYTTWGYTNRTNYVIVNDGQFSYSTNNWAYGFDNEGGTVTINGGVFTASTSNCWSKGLYNSSDAVAIVNGGVFTATATNWSWGFQNYGLAIINGGEFSGTASEDWAYGFENSGTAIITGGQFTSSKNWWSRGIHNQGNLTIYGTFAQYGYVPYDTGYISGIIGGVYQTISYRNSGGTICLKPIPEPSSIVGLLCGISGIGGMMWRRRKLQQFPVPVK